MTFAPKLGLALSGLLLSGAALTSCHDANDPGTEYAPQMYDSVPYEPLRQVNGYQNKYNPMGINERVPAQGSIPRGKLAYFSHIAPDSVSIAERVLKNPFPATPENLEAGKVLYGRYCVHCHGEEGNGQGLVGIKFKGVPNYASASYKNMNAGHIYHVIQYGKNRMMPHGSQVAPDERWKIALYVYTLQHKDDAQAPADGGASAGTSADSAKLNTGAAPATALSASVSTKSDKVTATVTATAPAAEPADTRTAVQKATDKIRATHVY